MSNRKTLALFYRYNEDWIGGTYYIQNIVRALKQLPQDQQPNIVVLYDGKIDELEAIGYDRISYVLFDKKLSKVQRGLNNLSLKILGSYLFRISLPEINYDGLYPMPVYIHPKDKRIIKTWIPDFQERYFPRMFSERERMSRELSARYIVNQKFPVVFSSNTAKNDFDNFYPGNSNNKIVLRFCSFLTYNYGNEQVASVNEKYGIRSSYYIVSNQFWRHKNHEVVIDAVAKLVSGGSNIKVVFTGKEHDYRDPEHTTKLKEKVAKLGLSENILFLGFIPREDQVILLKNSVAVIQPSLFEGWSTVVEDCKALNKLIVLSEIPVHVEQIKHNCIFFDPLSAESLQQAVKKSADYTVSAYNYEKDRLEFGKSLLTLL